MNNLPRILLVDEDVADRRLASLVLAGEFGNVDLEAVGTAAEFSRALSQANFGLAIIEGRCSWGEGPDLVRLVRDIRADCPVILFTADEGEELWSASLRLGVDGYVRKSSDGFVRLPSVVRSVFYQTRRRAAAGTRDAPYRRLIEGLPVGVFAATLEGEILEANPAFAGMLGFFDSEEVSWSSFARFFVDPAAADTWRNQMATARYVGNFDTQLQRVDGSSVWARVSSWVSEDPASGRSQIQGLVEETGDYHDAQQALVEQAETLARSNSELEQFAYVVSHDLQQPLSLVSSYLEMLADSCGGKLSDEEESYLDRAAGGAVRVQEMVDAVLGYARIDSRGGEFADVDLGLVLDEVKSALWKEVTCARAEITSDELPTVHADPAQMEQLLHNLISNSLKFAGGNPARVHLGAMETEKEWQISVRDEGIGIDSGALERVFVMFQRLHTEKEFPGTGIGLAICKRIVERHGGRIWVESEPKIGATFHFAIPKRSGMGGV